MTEFKFGIDREEDGFEGDPREIKMFFSCREGKFELKRCSHKTTKEMVPLYSSGNLDPRDFKRNKNPIAGSFISIDPIKQGSIGYIQLEIGSSITTLREVELLTDTKEKYTTEHMFIAKEEKFTQRPKPPTEEDFKEVYEIINLVKPVEYATATFEIGQWPEELEQKSKCECGTDSVSGGIHSDYCPKYNK
jgi:hypothetical protein